MAHNRVFVIGIEKSSFYIAACIAILAVAFGIFLLSIPNELITSWHRFNNPLLVNILSCALIFYGLIILIASIKEIISTSPAVLINEEYIKISNKIPIYSLSALQPMGMT